MKSKVTIAAIAKAAGVSTATVDRVLNSRLPVRENTALTVIDAAEKLGYHAAHVMKQRLPKITGKHTLGFCLQTGHSTFYEAMAQHLRAQVGVESGLKSVQLAFMDSFDPARIAEHMLASGKQCDALAVVAVDHPFVTDAVNQLHRAGVPTLALLSDLSADKRLGYVGVDNAKRGRTAAWFIHRLNVQAGKVGVMVGSHRYMGQEANEMAFRSALRDRAPHLDVLEARINLEDDAMSYEVAIDLLARHPDLVGIYVIAGSFKGAERALRETHRDKRVVGVAHELTPEHQSALLHGAADVVLRTPLARVCTTATQTLLGALGPHAVIAHGQPFVVPFDVITVENI